VNDTQRTELGDRWFRFGCMVEVFVAASAAALAWLLGTPLLSDFHWDLRAAAWGVAGTVPLLGVFGWMLQSTCRPFVEISVFLEQSVRPVLAHWSWAQLAVISILAGVCEELFFRSVLQGGLTGVIGTVPALLISSALFGVLHMVTRTYAVLAGLVGIYLGVLWLASGNLLTPILVHALYDFAALMWLQRIGTTTGSA
jgi:uncharacterized protein